MISIIIPFYNRISKVIKSVESVFNQTYEDWELILVNDCSNEDCSKINDLLIGPKSQRVIYVCNLVNEGPGYCRNKGIEISCGNSILFLDSDDILDKTFLEKSVKVLTDNLLFVYSTAIWDDYSTYRQSNNSYCEVIPLIIKYGRPWPTSAVLWNKRYVLRYDKSLRNWEDYLFEFECALQNNNIYHINEKLVIISKPSANSLTSLENTVDGLIYRIRALDLMLVKLGESKIKSKLKIRLIIIKKLIHFIIKLKKMNVDYTWNRNSKTMRLIPNNILILKFLRTSLRLF